MPPPPEPTTEADRLNLLTFERDNLLGQGVLNLF